MKCWDLIKVCQKWMNIHVIVNLVMPNKKRMLPPGNVDGSGFFRPITFENTDSGDTSPSCRKLGENGLKEQGKGN